MPGTPPGMDVLIPLLIVLLLGFAFAWSVYGRRGHKQGGITVRPPAPGATSGSAQDSSGENDRAAFTQETDDHGAR
jgi:hypothetical protein